MLRLFAIMLLASLIGAALIRIAPGFSSDEQQLNSGLSAQSIHALRQARLTNSDVPHYFAGYLASLLRGDLGTSQSLNQPVSGLLRDRVPVTLRSLAVALLLAWIAGLSLAAAAQLVNSRLLTFITDGLSGTFISTPAVVLALLFVLLRWPPQLAATLLVFPKIYRYCQNLLQQSYELPHVLTARAKGAGPWRVLMWHVAPIALPQLLALVGVSVSIAIGVLMGWALWPARNLGFRRVAQQGVTLVTFGFFGIGFFGILYATCALLSDEAFGHVTRLGYPFLFSTSLGVAGGVLGEPKGFARVLTHIQLLLFMSALISVIAVVLGIERNVRRQG